MSRVAKEPGATLAVDGYFGKESIKALQMLLVKENISTGPVDGRLGCRTKKGVQQLLAAAGYEVGGRLGCCSKTTKALQQWVRDRGGDPGPVDGRWGRKTSAALQAVLNKLLTVEPQLVKGETAGSGSPLVIAEGVPLAAQVVSLKELAP